MRAVIIIAHFIQKAKTIDGKKKFFAPRGA
jgi:hypothetical protein